MSTLQQFRNWSFFGYIFFWSAIRQFMDRSFPKNIHPDGTTTLDTNIIYFWAFLAIIGIYALVIKNRSMPSGQVKQQIIAADIVVTFLLLAMVFIKVIPLGVRDAASIIIALGYFFTYWVYTKQHAYEILPE